MALPDLKAHVRIPFWVSCETAFVVTLLLSSLVARDSPDQFIFTCGHHHGNCTIPEQSARWYHFLRPLAVIAALSNLRTYSVNTLSLSQCQQNLRGLWSSSARPGLVAHGVNVTLLSNFFSLTTSSRVWSLSLVSLY